MQNHGSILTKISIRRHPPSGGNFQQLSSSRCGDPEKWSEKSCLRKGCTAAADGSLWAGVFGLLALSVWSRLSNGRLLILPFKGSTHTWSKAWIPCLKHQWSLFNCADMIKKALGADDIRAESSLACGLHNVEGHFKSNSLLMQIIECWKDKYLIWQKMGMCERGWEKREEGHWRGAGKRNIQICSPFVLLSEPQLWSGLCIFARYGGRGEACAEWAVSDYCPFYTKICCTFYTIFFY